MSFAAVLGAKEPVSKLGASQSGTCLRFGEARGLTVFGEPGKQAWPTAAKTAGANWKRALTGNGENSASGLFQSRVPSTARREGRSHAI
jgi:hypothetical protein